MTDYLKTILTAFHDLLFIFTTDGIIEDYIATNHEDELILPRESFIGKNHREVLPPDVSNKIDQAFHKLVEGHDYYKFDYSLKVKGEIKWYTAVFSKIETGDFPRYLGVVRNISDRKNQEMLLHSILNTSPGGIMVFDVVRDSEGTVIDFEITQMNKSVELLTGVSEEELVGQSLMTVTDDRVKEKLLNQLITVVEKGAPLDVQYQHINEQGEVFWYHSRFVKYRDGVVSTFMDITKQKETETKLAGKNEELIELNRQKDKLFSVISHDLRNASAGARGVYDVILDNYEELSKDEILEYLHILNQRTHNTHELLEDLLDWSKNQFQEVSTVLEKLHLASLTDKIFDHVRLHAESLEIELLNQIPATIFVHADANMIKTVLRNLVGNGIKFTKPGGRIIINAEKEDGRINISVKDDGIGMDEETRKKVMNKQINFTSPGTSGEKGAGLGLELCMDFVEKHGGEIWVESEPGRGSTFTFTLPEYSKVK